MTEKEYEELIRENVQHTLGASLVNDAVVEELARRVSANVIALINVLEIEDACPVEYEQLVQENVQTTLGRHFGFDAVVEELSRRVSANVIALINVLEIEDACPVCGTVMPDTASVSPQVLFEEIYESLKKTADRWIAMGNISIRSADAIYAMLGEMGREASQKAIAIFISERAKRSGT